MKEARDAKLDDQNRLFDRNLPHQHLLDFASMSTDPTSGLNRVDQNIYTPGP